jgi:hypothetical protein
MPTTCPAYLILFDLITIIISGEEYKLYTPYCAVFLNFPLPYIFLNTPFSNTLTMFKF